MAVATASTSEWFVVRSRCPACDHPDSTTILCQDYNDPAIRDYLTWFYSQQGPGIEPTYLSGAEYKLEECAGCGLIYQEQVPGDELMVRLYETWIDSDLAWQRHINKPRTPSFFGGYARDLLRLHQFLGARPYQLQVLDFGMGWGNWCQMAHGFGCSVNGVEVSQARIDHARRHGIPVLTHDRIADHQFDFIHTEQVFEHIPSPRNTLATLVSSLRPGGVIQLSVPNGTDIRSRLDSMDWRAPKGSLLCINAVAPLEHINCFNHHSLVALAASQGLKPIRSLACGPRASRHQRILNALRRLRDALTGRWKRSTFLFFQSPGEWTPASS